MRLKKLPRGFYLRPTLTVARELPGKFLVRRIGANLLVGRIVEVEAYLGERDAASHAYRGKTKRNAVMFGEGGHLYVYFTYGMHFCSNVVTEREGIGHAVLLRSVEPVRGFDLMRRNRSVNTHLDLCNGPAKLCQAFGIARPENGTDLCGNKIWLATAQRTSPGPTIRRTTRVGISAGKHHRWRFFIKDDPFVSPGKTV